MIDISNLKKTFDNGHSWVVNDISFTIQRGETLVLLGSSGSGKSTVLKMINGLIAPSVGNIHIEQQAIENYDPILLRRKMGYVFQEIGLFPHLTVAENISIVLRLIQTPLNVRQNKTRELLDLIGLPPDKFMQRYPAELSGGQQQRVGVARALAADPDYLLMDEPFGALDANTRADLQMEILRLKKELNKTIVFVTHDIFEALRLADRMAVMHHGKIEQIATKQQLLQNPATPFVQHLLHNTAQQIRDFVGEQNP